MQHYCIEGSEQRRMQVCGEDCPLFPPESIADLGNIYAFSMIILSTSPRVFKFLPVLYRTLVQNLRNSNTSFSVHADQNQFWTTLA